MRSLPAKIFSRDWHVLTRFFRILNPLAGISKEELLLRVSAFCVEVGLQEHLSVFQKGALVAQSPSDFENISELDEDDKYHLRREITRRLT